MQAPFAIDWKTEALDDGVGGGCDGGRQRTESKLHRAAEGRKICSVPLAQRPIDLEGKHYIRIERTIQGQPAGLGGEVWNILAKFGEEDSDIRSRGQAILADEPGLEDAIFEVRLDISLGNRGPSR